MAKADKSRKITDLWSKYGLQLALLAVLGIAALSFIALGLIKLTTQSNRILPMVATKVSQPIQTDAGQPEARLPKPLPPLVQATPEDKGGKTEIGEKGQVRVRGQVTRPDAAQTGPASSAKPAETGQPSKDTTTPGTATASPTKDAIQPDSAAAAPAQDTAKPATAPAQDTARPATAPASEEAAASPPAPARLKPASTQDTTKAGTEPLPTASTAPAQETPPATATTAGAPPATVTTPTPQAAPARPQAPASDQPPASVPLEATMAMSAPAATGSPQAETEDDRFKLPKPRWQTVEDNWDQAKLAGMGEETMDTGDSPWKQLDVGETDQVTTEGGPGQAIPEAPLMGTKPDQVIPATAAATTASKAPAGKSKSTSTKTVSRASGTTASTRTSTKNSHTKTARTGSTSTAPRPGLTLSIINETGQPGQGNAYRDVLQAMGYQVKSVIDRPPQSGPTTILYNSGLKDKAVALARRIPGQRTVAPQQAPYSQDIVIVVR